MPLLSKDKAIALRKFWRFFTLYGLMKTLFKSFGRIRPACFSVGSSRRVRDIGLIGCGQYAFATIGYSVWRVFGNRFIACFDINKENQNSFAKFFNINLNSNSSSEVIDDERVKVLYIASNHASHTDYAVEAMQAGKRVYIEKPIAVTMPQFKRLAEAYTKTGIPVFAGYNRPFSGAVRQLRKLVDGRDEPMTLACFVSGHVLGQDHWYRKPEEGTRICGNVGHWLDLAVHMLSWGKLPDQWQVTVVRSNANAPDDDLSITLVSERNDLVNIVMTSRTEPFEGINETINFQQHDVIAKIDDFRKMVIWNGHRLNKFRYWPKDIGHQLAIMQPFSKINRAWEEVEHSTVLMLFIAEMVSSGKDSEPFSFSEQLAKAGIVR